VSRARLAAVMLGLSLLAGSCSCRTDADRASAPDTRLRATIRRAPDGVPHIVAPDFAGLAFGEGYASAQDRSCDLADEVIKVRGERARWLGPGDGDANVTSDIGWRTIGLFDRAAREYPLKSDEIRTTFDAFAAGWSRYLGEVGSGGIAGWCRGAPWVLPVTGLDVYAYARSIALYASSAQFVSYLAAARPPGEAPVPPTTTTTGSTATATTGSTPPPPAPGSNGWALGRDRSASGAGMLLANPHFPWEREQRFWEVHLTVPGAAEIYGAQLSGLPGIGIGFNRDVAWTHTVSSGSRFTAYRLDLVPGRPTTYRWEGGERAMTARSFTVEVRQPDGSTQAVPHTSWYSHHGPVVSLPGAGWTGTTAVALRDANIDDDESTDQNLAMSRARGLDELIEAHRRYQGIPLFNTIAAGRDGRVWYADTSATPNLTKEALTAYEATLKTDALVASAAESSVVLLDGTTARTEWVNEPGAREPGLVPWDRMPKVERTDYVFNANDSFWLANAEHPIEGDYPRLTGDQRTIRSLRTRENATILRDTGPGGPAGADGRFTLDELTTAALANTGYSARLLRDAVVARCTGRGEIDVPADTTSADPAVRLPAARVDVGPACRTLAGWDGTYDLDDRGAALWREFMSRFESRDLREPGRLYAEGFDPARPVDTPSGLAPPPSEGPDPVLVNLARAVQILEKAAQPVDAPLGALQFADRNGQRVGVHGGSSYDGTTNIVGFTNAAGTTTEKIPSRSAPLAPRSALTRDGYPVNFGSSFVMAVDLGGDTPTARVLLAYGNTQDRADPAFVDATRSFSEKRWRTVHLGADGPAAAPTVTENTIVL
jgi:acyl-homoserine-lactone acylase